MKKCLIFCAIISVFLMHPVWAVTSTEVAKLLASDGDASVRYGMSVAIDGNTAVIGTYFDGPAGSAYIYTRSEGVWTEQAKLLASEGQSRDQFGRSVAISGDTVVIGAFYDGDKGKGSGSAYIFTRSGTTWTEQKKLLASDGAMNDKFGFSVAIARDTVVIGAYGDNSSSGSAYVYTRSGTIWSEQEKLLASDGASSSLFGYSVAIDLNTIVIGARYDDDYGDKSGSAYVFTRLGETWAEQAKLLASDGGADDHFGVSAAIDSDTVVIGAYGNDEQGGSSGAAYVFTRSEGAWTEQQKLLASNGYAGDVFGESVALSGNIMLIGARGHDNQGSSSGAVYAYTRYGGTWTEEERLLASDGEAGDFFGFSVAIEGEAAIIGVYVGSAYIFSIPDKAIQDSPELSVWINGSKVLLTWSPVEGASGYKLYYAPYPYTGPESISFIDVGNTHDFSIELWEGAAYYVAISAYNSAGESDYSNVEQFSLK